MADPGAPPTPEPPPLWSGGDSLCFSPLRPRVGTLGVTFFRSLSDLCNVRLLERALRDLLACHPSSQFTEAETRAHRGERTCPQLPRGPGQGQGGSQACGLQPLSLWARRGPRDGHLKRGQ